MFDLLIKIIVIFLRGLVNMLLCNKKKQALLVIRTLGFHPVSVVVPKL